MLDYQVPVVRCMDLPQGTYQVTVSGCLTSGSGAASAKGKSASCAAISEQAQAAEQEDIVAEVVKQLGFRDINAKDVEISYMDAGSVLASGTSAVSQKQTVSKKMMAESSLSGNTDAISLQYAVKNAAVSVAEAIATTAGSEDEKLTASTAASVYLDGVRIYNTMEKDSSYVASEQNISYGSVYDYVNNSLDTAKDWTEQAVVYVEYDGEQDAYSIEDYKEKGPENEVYLTPGSQIAFVLQGYEQGDTVQIAAKAISDTVQVNGLADVTTIDTATELYYTVTPQYDAEKERWYVLVGSQKDSKGLLSLSACKLSTDLTPGANAAFAQYILDQRSAGAGETTDSSTDESSENGTGSSGDSIVAPGNGSGNGDVSDSATGTFYHAYMNTIKNLFKKVWNKKI